jgi:exonuclease SbcC
MVPLSLTLRNFLSYGEEEVTLDFSNMHVVCLSGENGHGKSALLDAITWVLWGETRLGKQGHEQLIRIGADEMSVVLVFRVGTDIYRVRRQRSRKTAGANWEIQRSDGSGGWIALTGTSASDTGRVIQQIVRMSYDTFLNSAYLKQGRADEFVRQTATRRKEILCEILELSRYDRLEEKAKQRSREFADLVADTDRQANQSRGIAADALRYRDELTVAEKTLADHVEAHSAVAQRRTEAERDLGDLHHQIVHSERLAKQIIEIETALRQINVERSSATAAISRQEALLSDRPRIESNYTALVAARKRFAELTEKLRLLPTVELDIFKAESEIRAETKDLEASVNRLRQLIEKGKAGRVEVEHLLQQLADLTTRRDQFGNLDELAVKLRAEYDEENDQLAQLKAKHSALLAEKDAEIQRRERLTNQSETCSICGSPLPENKIEGLIRESETRIAAITTQANSVRIEGTVRRRELDAIRVETDSIDSRQKQVQELTHQVVRIEQQRESLVRETAAFADDCAEYEQVSRALAAGYFAETARKTLSALETRRDELLPLRMEQQDVEKTIASLQAAEDDYRALSGAEQSLAPQQQILSLAEKQAVSLARQKAELNAQINQLAGATDRAATLEGALHQLLVDEKAGAEKMAEQQMLIGRLQRSLEQCANAETKVTQLEKERDQHKHEENLHKVLAAAFGKRGIQANIIEAALPELQQYANEILDRLTDGDLRVTIETTRQARLKGAGTIDTLEIKISDNLGTRPLEMYSGGEAFRVSFALRIALSMLLVRRAGAELQTLMIDEGFGTQDAKGREKLVDAINGIKQDFDQIMVITHIDELKEAFGTRIEVYKTSEGSQLRVVQGDAIG